MRKWLLLLPLLCAGCVSVDYVGKKFAPVPTFHVKVYESASEVPADKYTVIGHFTASSPPDIHRFEVEYKVQTLEEKKSELNEIVSENKQKEETLREKAKKQENKIEERLLTAFKRIRKNTRNGLGIVVVQRNACGGCFNRIPAQRQMEIKMHKKVIVCEYCGRILIDPELVGIAPEEAKNK